MDAVAPAKPPGDGGGEHPGWVGVLGPSTPQIINGGSGRLACRDACKLARRLPRPSAKGRVSRLRDSAAAGLGISALCATFFPAPKGPARGELSARSGKMWE